MDGQVHLRIQHDEEKLLVLFNEVVLCQSVGENTSSLPRQGQVDLEPYERQFLRRGWERKSSGNVDASNGRSPQVLRDVVFPFSWTMASKLFHSLALCKRHCRFSSPCLLLDPGALHTWTIPGAGGKKTVNGRRWN